MKQLTTYQGLFLIAIGLYGYERTRPRAVVIQKEVPDAADISSVPISPELDAIYKKLKVASVFATPIDGLRTLQFPRTLKIELKSEELYEDGEVALEETWLPVLDQIGNALFENGEPKADLIFASNASASSENDSFAFSTSRADWILHYFGRKYQLDLRQGKYRVMGLGKTLDDAGKSVPTIQILIKPTGEP